MVMSSHQISAMAQQQQAMFGNAANYAQQITPPGPMFGGYGTGPLPGPPPATGMQTSWGGAPQGGLMSMASQIPYQMPGQYITQGFSEQLTGTALGGAAGLASGVSNIAGTVTGAAGLATMGAAGLGALGIGGGVAGLAALPMGGALVAAGGVPAMAVAGGLAAGAYGVDQMYEGYRERQDVNRVMRQRFGGQMGVGSGRGGMGFSSQEMGQMSTMMRGMANDDMFTSFDELTRTLDKTSQMGLYRGVQSAKEFREKFRKTVDTLKEVAKTMHTSLDEAAGLMEGQRQQGFFSGSDINSSLMRTRMNAGATGMSMQQMQAIGQQGTMMGRSMGMLGRTGSQAMQEMASNTAMAMQMGIISDEDIAEATGGLTGAEGAQAYAARQMQGNSRWMKRGAGRAMLAGMWNQEGGIDRTMMNKVMSGEVSFREVLSEGRKNIRETGGRRSSFFLDEDRLAGQAMAEGGGDVMIGMLAQHISGKKGLEAEDPIVKRWLMKQTGKTRAEIDVALKQYRKMPEILQERKVRFSQQLETEGRSRAREASGFRGFRRRMGQWWDQEVSGPLRQAGDDVTQAIDDAVDGLHADLEGRVKMTMTQRAKDAQIELRSTGKSDLLAGGGGTLAADTMKMARRKYRDRIDTSGGMMGSIGRFIGARGESLDDRLRGVGAHGAFLHAGASEQEKLDYLKTDADRFSRAQDNLNLTKTQQAELESAIGGAIFEGGRMGKDVGAAEAGFFSGTVDSGENFAAIQTRIDFLEQQSPVFKQMAAGKSRHEKIALLQKGSKDLKGTKYELEEYGTGAGSRARSLAGDLKALELYEKDVTRKSNVFFRKQADKAGTRRVITSQKSGMSTVVGEIDMGGLFTISEGNEKLARHLQVLSNPDADPSERADAIKSLKRVGAGADEDELGINVSDQAKSTAAAVAYAAEKDAKGTAKALAGRLVIEDARAQRISDETRRNQARKLRNYMGKDSTKARLEANVKGEVLDKFRELIDARTKVGDGVTPKQLEKMEEEFLMENSHTEEGANLIAALGDDPSTAYQVGAMRRVRDWVKRGGKQVLKDSPEGERQRVKSMLQKSLGAAGGLSALGDRREQRQWLKKIKEGEVSAKEIMEHMRKEAGGTLELAEGVTTKQLESHLGGLVGDIKSGGKFSKEEYLQRGADAAQRAEQEERSGGGGKSIQDLPSLAQKQVEHLSNMVKLTKIIAKKQGITVNIKDGKVVEDPSGGDTKNE